MRSPLLPPAVREALVLRTPSPRFAIVNRDRRRVGAAFAKAASSSIFAARVRKAHLVSERILRVLAILGGGRRVDRQWRQRRPRLRRVGAVALPFEGGPLALDLGERPPWRPSRP